ncbi:MAG: lysylphosphatidylglycerol synthase transmembrane domain-containing protein [Candidatus Dormibacteria bacterium]
MDGHPTYSAQVRSQVSTPLLDLAPAVPAAVPADGATPVGRARGRLVRRITRLATVVISVGALAILLRRVDLPASVRTAAAEPWPALAAAVAVNAVATWLRAARSQTVLNALGHRVNRLRMMGTQLAGQTLSWVSPAAAGDFVRPYLWRSHDGVPLTPGVVTVLYERIFSFGQLMVLGAVCLAPSVLGGAALAAAVAGAVCLLTLPWLVPRLGRAVAEAVERRGAGGWRSRLALAAGRLWRLAGDGRLTLRFTILTVAVVAASAVQIEVLGAGVGVALPIWTAAAAYTLSQVIGSASSLPFGLGPADAVLIALLVHAGAGPAGALAITLLTRLTVTLPLGLAGALAYLRLGRPTPARLPVR